MSEKITEQTLSIEELTALEMGGNAIQTLYPESLPNMARYTVKNATGVKTEWGARIDYIIADDVAEWRISSWNCVMKGKFKALELVGKNINLIQWKSNPKKFLLEVVN